MSGGVGEVVGWKIHELFDIITAFLSRMSPERSLWPSGGSELISQVIEELVSVESATSVDTLLFHGKSTHIQHNWSLD